MRSVITETLDPKRQDAVRALAAACSRHDCVSHSFPLDEEGIFLLREEECVPLSAPAVRVGDPAEQGICPKEHGGDPAEQSPRVLVSAAMALIPAGGADYECFALTHPDHRNKGLFSGLLEKGIERIGDDKELLFYADASCRAALETLDAIGAERTGTECMLRLPAEDLPRAALSGGSSAPLAIRRVTADGEPTLQYENPYGSLFIIVRPASYYLFGFEIREQERGHGRGTELLDQVLSDLAHRGPRPVVLEVSGENAPALALYKKTGFRTLETLCCYVY